MHNDPNEISEGEHLSDSLEGFDDDTFVPQHGMSKLLVPDGMRVVSAPTTKVARYTANKAAAVGTSLQCPTCNFTFTKTSYQQAFCKQNGKKCKDRYHNSQPHRIQRTLNWPAR